MAKRTHPKVTSRWMVLIVAVTMLTVFFPAAIASHNSAGADPTIAIPTEVDLDPSSDTYGELQPDIPPDSPYLVTFHNEEAEEGLISEPRQMPPDQTGERYTDCTTHEEALAANEEWEPWENEDQCYVGYLDNRWTAVVPTLIFTRQPADDLYAVNPDDDHCAGQEDDWDEEEHEVTGIEPVDRELTSLDRALTEEECQGAGHAHFIPGQTQIDVNLLNAGFDGSDEGFEQPGIADVTREDSASGSHVLPITVTPYVFLFGEPHPDADDEIETDRLDAGEPPFSGSPIDGASPLFDLEGACGDRTDQCKLLHPDDVRHYDRYNPDEPGEPAEQSRVCLFTPQFTVLNPDERGAGVCGVNGSNMDQFYGAGNAGGFGTGEATWLGLLPGWYIGVTSLSQTGEIGARGGGGLADFAAGAIGTEIDMLTPAGPVEHSGDGMLPGVAEYLAVNPLVPDAGDHELWCVVPGFLTHGDGDNDPGFYGTYAADAIDADVYVSPFLDQYEAIIEASQDAGITELTPDEFSESLPAVSEQVQEEIEQLQRDNEMVDRAMLLESSAEKNLALEEPFTRDVEGIACDHLGQVQDLDPDTLLGNLVFDVQVSHSTSPLCVAPLGIPTGVCTPEGAIKDPTHIEDEGPAKETETERGAWQPDSYTFGGEIIAFYDTSEESANNGFEFNECAPATGAPSPANDRCVWHSIWDAYHPQCQDLDENLCYNILEDRGYDVEAGVGLVSVLTVSGPFATWSITDNPDRVEERNHVIGLEDEATAQHCVVATSHGFHGANQTLDEGVYDILGHDTMEDAVDALCEEAGADGEFVHIPNGFSAQAAGTNPGTFSSAFSFAKLAPTPSETTDTLGDGDQVCVTGFWHVQDGLTDDATRDTRGNLDLGHNNGEPHSWSDCYGFESTTQ